MSALQMWFAVLIGWLDRHDRDELGYLIEASRRVQILGSTPHSDEAFMRQVRVLICDGDTKWSGPVREYLREAGIRIVQTQYQAPNANAYAERFARSIKEECLDRIIPLGERWRRQGQTTHTETVGMFDGKDNPVKGAPAPNTTTAYKRVDRRTLEASGKVDGKPTVTTKIAISADGKTMTATQKGKNAQGQTVNNVIVADKQ